MAYTARATAVAGRNGHVRTNDDALSLDLTAPKELGGPGRPGTTNPEQLFAAGYAACFGSAVQTVARAEKVAIGEVEVTADVTLHKEEDNFYLSATLRARVAGVDTAAAEHLVKRAHDTCPYSKATRNNIKVEVVLA